ncbi:MULTISPECIES: DUF6543 domain-containing protein [unclassified Pseudomonas]|uniref:DUF6543 domain-containing protein n=1 Tax=unclassified Pseudomonas TaxID=196821 RepID=UPI00244BA807|nr:MULTISPECIES: DUF6543 domain-containing protein [unclassified Pseudomonas]MDH0303905.1 hypothetical protein [Pseudomonas sp. GD04091]MDH1985137.1 hypothetical protein [Pseudomonas sp. GD03689]
MPATSAVHPLSFRSLVSTRFRNRPTLRQVLAKAAFETLADHYPWIRVNHPQLHSLEAFTVIHAPDPQGNAQHTALLDDLLERFLTDRNMALAASDHLSVAPPQVFRPQPRSTKRQEVNLDMPTVNTIFDRLLDTLTGTFQQAQISFWNGSEGDSDVPRLRWMEQVLKAALLSAIERQGLDETGKDALYALVNGTDDTLVIHGMQVTLGQQDTLDDLMLPDLLITGQRGAPVLWSKPSGTVRSYPDLPAFANALRDELADRYDFDAMTWACKPLDGDAFSYQANQLLNLMLDDIGRLQLRAIDKVSDLQALFGILSDPGLAFPGHAGIVRQPLDIPLPSWLATASTQDRFQYHTALLELSASQALSRGATSLDGIEDLRQYAARRLREQMQADHPDKLQHDPGQLIITVAQRVQTSSLGPVRLDYLKTLTLTDLAISRLQSTEQEVATTVADVSKPIDARWMNLDYVAALIDRVDVGGQYPLYVDRQLHDSARQAARLVRFTTEWHNSLLLSALRAKIEGQLDERAWQVLADFCRGREDDSPRVSMAPLAFRCAPGASTANQAHCMFVIRVHAPRTWILYRPLIGNGAVKAFASQDQLMASIRAKGEVQDSVLAWLDDDARPIYENDGFTRPHLHRHLSELAHLVGAGSALSDSLLRQLQDPVTIDFSAWTGDLDDQVLKAKAKAMVLLASRQSVSNAQQRWALIMQCAWLAFNTLTPLLPGPVGTVAWLIATLTTLQDDLSSLTEGTTAQRALAGSDLLINLAMLLVHGSAPSTTGIRLGDDLRPRFHGPAPRETGAPGAAVKPETRAWKNTVDARRSEAIAITRWHGNQRLGNLPPEQLEALNPLRARISLVDHVAVAAGRLRGLYKVGEHCYVKLQGHPYEIEETWGGIRIIGPEESRGQWADQWGGNWDGYYIPGRERKRGPWITRWNGEWMLDLNLAGGMPRTLEATREDNRKAFDALRKETRDIDEQLKKNETLARRYLEQTKDYDAMAKAFNQALARHPGAGPDNLPDDLRGQLQALRDLRSRSRTGLYMLSLTYEKLSSLLTSQVRLYAQLSEPRFTRFDRKNVSTYAHGVWWEQLIETDLHLFHNLLDLTDYQVLKEQSTRLASLPVGQEQATLFREYRSNLEAALATHKRMLTTSRRLDESLSTVLNDAKIQFKNKKARLDEIIAQRQYSIVIVHAQVISDISQLVIARDLLTQDNHDQLLHLLADLRNRDFHEALLSHDSLIEADLPLDQQAEILATALREYEISIGKASYLLSLADTEPALDRAWVNDYIGALSDLKSLAESELSNCLRDSDQGVAPPARPMTHRARPAKPRLIRTNRGRAVLADEEPGSRRAVQNDPLTHAAFHYEQRGDHWQDVAGAAVTATRSNADLRRTGRRLLAQKDERIALAKRYANEPNSLADLMDWQIEDMSGISQKLNTGTAADKTLASQLDTAVQEMQEEKRRMLTDAYFNTRHPDSTALGFLVRENQVEVMAITVRKRLKANDYLDVYSITRKAPRQKLWEAHFHYSSAQAAPRAFAKGHLKFWEPRAMSRAEQLERSTTARERISIYRGDLRLAQIEGLIPFPAS